MSDDLRKKLEDDIATIVNTSMSHWDAIQKVAAYTQQLIESRERAALERSQSEAFIAGCLYGGIPVEDTEIIVKAYHEWRKEALQQSGGKVEG